MEQSLSSSSTEAALLFDKLLNIHAPESFSILLHDMHDELDDQHIRFKIWAGNQGALQRISSESSLEYKLKDSRRIANHVHSLLVDLVATLQDLLAIVSGNRENRTAESGLTESYELLEMLKSTISNLFRIGILIRKSSPRDDFARAFASTEPLDATTDIRHVQDKFPLLKTSGKEWLGDRLGNAIAQRRQYLSYARSHRDKIGEQQPEQHQHPVISTSAESVEYTVASTSHSSNTPTELNFNEGSSVASSAKSLVRDADGSYLQPPSLRTASMGENTFECPFCRSMQSFRKESSWQKHVYADLQAYVCTFVDCRAGLFSSQEEWFEHEAAHRTHWNCLICQHQGMKSDKVFREHLRSHQSNTTDAQLDALSKIARQPPDQYRALDCPFCHNWNDTIQSDTSEPSQFLVSPNQFMEHVGSHMQQLALFALPKRSLSRANYGATLNQEAQEVAVDLPSVTFYTPDVSEQQDKNRRQGKDYNKTTSISDTDMTSSSREPAGIPFILKRDDLSQPDESPRNEITETTFDKPLSQNPNTKPNNPSLTAPGGFLFQINEIAENPTTPSTITKHGQWQPSVGVAHDYLKIGVSGRWWLCDGQQIKPFSTPAPGTTTPFKSISMYYCSGLGFWVTHGDATSQDAYGPWKPLTFDHDARDYSSYLTDAGIQRTLQCVRLGERWPGMLLPDIYQKPPAYYHAGYGGLKGDIGIFLALIAFSMDRSHLKEHLPLMFLKGQWRIHNFPHGRFDQRGVVVSIHTGPGLMTLDDLYQYEEGKYGPYYN